MPASGEHKGAGSVLFPVLSDFLEEYVGPTAEKGLFFFSPSMCRAKPFKIPKHGVRGGCLSFLPKPLILAHGLIFARKDVTSKLSYEKVGKLVQLSLTEFFVKNSASIGVLKN